MRELVETTSRPAADLPLALERDSAVSMAAQLGDQLRAAMRSRTLPAGERLPSTRGLAARLGVSRTVVTEAYQQLYAEGWLEGRHGSGTYVADLPARAGGHPAGLRHDEPGGGAEPEAEEPGAPEGAIDLRPGSPWVRDYDHAAWRRAWRKAADLPPRANPDPYGLPRLRDALATHLRRTRAVLSDPGGVLVTRGTGNGLDLVAATVLRPGDRVGVEEPGYSKARNIFTARGARIVPCPVDEDGLIVDDLPDDLRLIHTTPAHQFPTGGRMPISRRERLVAWARRTGALIVEDDYDAEFRYDVAPLPALHGLDPESVVLLGTLSKSLAPDIGVGWLLAGRSLLDAVARTRIRLVDRTSGPVQAAVAVLMERGDLDRHLRRMRLEYARRRAAIVESLGPLVRGDTAGLHVMVELPEGLAPRVARDAVERGVLLDTTVRHHHGPVRVHGLVLGYGSATLSDVRKGCAVIAGLIGDSGTRITF
ncbi:PLP-dependent aminotransferase family protein [Spongiactinospora sp. TRM90649]|uniref:MocR-like pyridoxine biosynthesis transcription factor PdxR n=1 Tax=Spongiactinospora sp. TRM90649 TaxID=3031114 RepID=UPI0023F66321|nr:PLP-dependent aminotransferase family protein [Spongiactinospora sp. TRM90649]MDF5757250.1 PLP-dependent aminotransferase family protein [Spongiactinospora sp. TRM90649]